MARVVLFSLLFALLLGAAGVAAAQDYCPQCGQIEERIPLYPGGEYAGPDSRDIVRRGPTWVSYLLVCRVDGAHHMGEVVDFYKNERPDLYLGEYVRERASERKNIQGRTVQYTKYYDIRDRWGRILEKITVDAVHFFGTYSVFLEDRNEDVLRDEVEITYERVIYY
jgi:hypothetical protein